MSPLLFRIALAALFSITSLIVIVLRVSPLTSPFVAVPLFSLTLFLSVAAIGALLFYAVWAHVSIEGMDAGRKLTISLREGVLLSFATLCLFAFQLLGLATWWIAILIYLVFLLIELALQS